MIVAAVAAAGTAGCQGADDVATPTADVPETVAIGELPETLTDSPTLPPPPPAPADTSGTTVPPGAVEQLVPPFNTAVDGDRLLFIGDGTLASAAPDVDQQLCDALSVFGWEAEIDAFVGADDLSYVSAVLDLRLRPDDGLDWDAVVVWVGNELAPDALGTTELEEVLDATAERIAPRPLIVYTLTELTPAHAELNEVIDEVAGRHANVGVIDWGEQAGLASEVLEFDGVTLASDGHKRLPLITASSLGEAPEDQDGGCLEPGVDTGGD